MIHLRDNFRPKAPVSQVPASWFNAVASFINNLVGGKGIHIVKNERGISRVDVVEDELDFAQLADQTAASAPKARAQYDSAETNASKIARVGTSDKAARADHVHPGINAAAVAFGSNSTVAAALGGVVSAVGEVTTSVASGNSAVTRVDLAKAVGTGSLVPTSGYSNLAINSSGQLVKEDPVFQSDQTFTMVTGWTDHGQYWFDVTVSDVTFDVFGRLKSVSNSVTHSYDLS